MKRVTTLMRALGVAALVLLVGTSVALAHGTPTMSAQPATVAAGGKIILSGDGMGTDGQTVTLILKGMTFQATLGTARLTDDAYNSATFTIPAKSPPGTYLVVAQNGAINASASIGVTASAAPKTAPVATAAKPTAVPTAMAGMATTTTPPPTATAAASTSVAPADQATVAPPLATTEPIAAQPVAATPATAATPLTTSEATGAPAVASNAPTAQPVAVNASTANAPADQTTGEATMPIAGAIPIPIRVRTPVEWALPIGFVVVAGGLGLVLLTRHLS